MNNAPTTGLSERRYDIDWLRVIAIGLLIIYHVGIAFQPWGVFIGFIASDEPLSGLWKPLSMLNVWRIPLLFYVSGMGVAFAIRKRNWGQLLGERSRRILLPLVFGMFCIVPLYLFIWQKYYGQELSYTMSSGHLWFLGNIFIYVVVLSPLFFLIKKYDESRVIKFLNRIFSSPVGLLTVLVLMIAEVMIVNPDSFELYVMTWHGFFLGLLAFLFGFIFVQTGKGLWNLIDRLKWILLVLAIGLYILRIVQFNLVAPYYLASLESNLWILAILGFAYRYLNRPGKALNYLSKAAYPVYILHMIFLYLATYFILPLDLPSWIEFILVIIATFTGCFLVHEFILRRIPIIGLLFGLKVPSGKKRSNGKEYAIGAQLHKTAT